MNARNKLNVAYTNGCLLMAAIAGGATGSWAVFLLAAAALASACVANGQIRHRPTRR
ncbi:hypothetical protein [Paludisphaera mucosa]|uniref:Lipoprotein n=1 Tax=Paludisphaera mucosa TaxID=3030827 RepID=A0ABT6FD20_9BACT|nr:hypothetical protein [Paludisphaera mucosa]MDG3005432.1 hypothetical protein [Paludisphaera mucosa]